jgi:hypothetical protein
VIGVEDMKRNRRELARGQVSFALKWKRKRVSMSEV